MAGDRRDPRPSRCGSGCPNCRSGAAEGSSQPIGQKRCWARVLILGLLVFSAGAARADKARMLAQAIDLGRVQEFELELLIATSAATSTDTKFLSHGPQVFSEGAEQELLIATSGAASLDAQFPFRRVQAFPKDAEQHQLSVEPAQKFPLRGSPQAALDAGPSPGTPSTEATGEAAAETIRLKAPEQIASDDLKDDAGAKAQASDKHEQQHKLPPLHVVTALYMKPDGLHDGVCSALGSMLLMGFDVTVLTWDWAEKRLPEVTGSIKSGKAKLEHTFKILMYQEWLRTQVEKEHEVQMGKGTRDGPGIQVLVDGSDVVFQQKPDELAASLISMMSPTHPIVASAQKTCYPIPVVGLETCRKAPRSPYEAAYIRHNSSADPLWAGAHDGAPRWLNSGAVAGPASDLLRIMESATSEEIGGFSDQAMFLRRYLTSQGAGGIQLDFAGALAHTVWKGEEDLERIPGSSPLAMRNKVTGAVPGIIHFNGKDKDIEAGWEITRDLKARIKQSLKDNHVLPGRLLHGNGKSMDFSSWCGGWP